MLRITVPATEQYDEDKNEFFSTKPIVLQLEHSLVSLSKWESKWHKPFISNNQKTWEETVDYIQCMTVTQNVDPSVYLRLTDENIDEVNAYIDNPMTATVFADNDKKVTNKKIVTAEIIYYWMISFNIPFECQKWHLNRLITLINVCNKKNQPQKKMGSKELIERNKSLNEARRKAYNSKG